MPPNWFLQFWRGQGDRAGISQGLRFWGHLREIPERYGGGQWRRPVQRAPVLAEPYESQNRPRQVFPQTATVDFYGHTRPFPLLTAGLPDGPFGPLLSKFPSLCCPSY